MLAVAKVVDDCGKFERRYAGLGKTSKSENVRKAVSTNTDWFQNRDAEFLRTEKKGKVENYVARISNSRSQSQSRVMGERQTQRDDFAWEGNYAEHSGGN